MSSLTTPKLTGSLTQRSSSTVSMLTRLSQYLFDRGKKRLGLSRVELERADMDYDEFGPEFDYERLMVKNGRPIGISAIIANDEITETEVSKGYLKFTVF